MNTTCCTDDEVGLTLSPVVCVIIGVFAMWCVALTVMWFCRRRLGARESEETRMMDSSLIKGKATGEDE